MRGQSVIGMILCRCRYAHTVNRNAQGIISNGNDILLMQKRTNCEQECTGDNQ